MPAKPPTSKSQTVSLTTSARSCSSSPGRTGPRLTGQTQPQTTRPLRSTPITGASPLLRAGPPARPATVLTPDLTPSYSLSPTKPTHTERVSPHNVVTRLPTFPARAADQAHAASVPDTAWPVIGAPTRPCSRSPLHDYDFDATLTLTTRQQRFGVTHLPGPHLTPPTMPFPHRSPRRSSANAACGGLKPPPDRRLRRATLHLLQNTDFRKVSPTYIKTSVSRSWHT